MTIVFEGYSFNDGTFQVKPPTRVFMSDVGDGIFRSSLPLRSSLEDSGDINSTFAVRFGLTSLLTDAADGFFKAKVPSDIEFVGDIPEPTLTVFSVGFPLPLVSFSSFETNDGQFKPKIEFDGFFSDATAVFRSQINYPVYWSDGHTVLNKYGLLLQQPMLFGSGHEGFTITLTEVIKLHPELDIVSMIMSLLQRVKIADSAPRAEELIKILSQKINFGDLLTYAQRMVLSQDIGLHTATLYGAYQVLALTQTLKLIAGPDWSAEVSSVLAAVFAIADKADAAQFESLTQNLHLMNLLSDSWSLYERLIQAIDVAAVATNSLLITAVLRDGVLIGDTPTNVAEILAILTSAVGVSAFLSTGDEAYTAWVLDAETKAAWRYDNYPFNSFAQLDGMFLGALPDGIYKLDGTDDDGTEIGWNVRSGLLNFNTQLLKRIDVAYIGYTASGEVGLSVYTTSPEGEKIQYNYAMVSRTANVTTANRIKVGRGLESTYWAFELVGTGDFSLSDMQILPMVLERRVQS